MGVGFASGSRLATSSDALEDELGAAGVATLPTCDSSDSVEDDAVSVEVVVVVVVVAADGAADGVAEDAAALLRALCTRSWILAYEPCSG